MRVIEWRDWLAENAEQDRRTIELLGSVLEGSKRPLLVTSGLARLAQGRLANESDVPDPAMPRKSEAGARAVAERGVRGVGKQILGKPRTR